MIDALTSAAVFYAPLGLVAVTLVVCLAGQLHMWVLKGNAPPAEGSQRVKRCTAGNSISYSVHGDPRAKYVVLYMHGLVGSRLEYFGSRFPLPDDCCVLTFDRPGYGRSSVVPLPQRTYRAFARNVAEILDDLSVRIACCARTGRSRPPQLTMRVGAECISHRLEQRWPLRARLRNRDANQDRTCWSAWQWPRTSRRARLPAPPVLVAADPPWGFVPASVRNRIHTVLLRLVRGCRPLLPVLAWLLSRALLAVLWSRPRSRVLRLMEPLRQTVRATTDEMIMERAHWGFELEHVRTPVWIVHGAQTATPPPGLPTASPQSPLQGTRDRLVPCTASHYMHSKLPQSTLVEMPRLGHALVRSLWPELVRLASTGAQDSVAALLEAGAELASEERRQRHTKRRVQLGPDADVSTPRSGSEPPTPTPRPVYGRHGRKRKEL